MFNLVISFSQLVGIIFSFIMMNRMSYQVKFIITLVPLIITMIAYPLVFEYTSEKFAWIFSNVVMAILGKLI